MRGLLANEGVRPTLENYGALVRGVLAAASDRLALAPEDIAGVTVFTTATEEALTGGLLTAATRLIQTAETRPPRFRVESVEDRGATVRVLGRMTSYEFRGPAQNLDAKRFASVPVPAPTVELDAVLTLPVDTPGAPLVIYGHGIDSRKEQFAHMADALAERGIATIAIDFVEHGSRYTGRTSQALSFVSLDFLPGATGNARQGVPDLLQLGRLAERDLDGLDVLPLGHPDDLPDVHGSRLGFLGESFGAIHGAMLTALEPNLLVSALVVGGGAWTDIAMEYPPLSEGNDGFGLVAAITELLNLPVSEFFTLLSVGQQVLAPGDPLSYSRRILKDAFPIVRTDRSILQIEVMDDDTVPNLANESLARALGIPLLEPARRAVPGLTRESFPARGNGPRGTTIGLMQLERFSDGRVVTHNNVLSVDETRDAVADFIADALAGRVPRIEEPLAQRSASRP